MMSISFSSITFTLAKVGFGEYPVVFSMPTDSSLNDFHRVSHNSPFNDVLKFGEPFSLFPPTWRSWQVEVWRFYSKDNFVGRRWQLDGTYWISSLAEFQTFYDRLPSTAGMYMYQRLCISCWLWDYGHRLWFEQICA